MTESARARLSSVHLEDLAVIALTASFDTERVELYPELSEDRRGRLRSRLKQIGRHDWPCNLKSDPHIRRGYTLRQCCRLIIALLLIDAHLPPSIAISIAANNEPTFLRAMAARLRLNGDRLGMQEPTDLLTVLILGELWEQVNETSWKIADPPRVRLVRRAQLGLLWNDEVDLGYAGQRLVVDVGGAAEAVWKWISGRQLLPENAREELISGIDKEAAAPGFAAGFRIAPRR